MRRSQAIASYSIRDGFAERTDLVGLWDGYFRSERRCPRCRRSMFTNGKGAFRCAGCDYHDKQDVRKLYKAGLGYNFSAKHNNGVGVFGKGRAL